MNNDGLNPKSSKKLAKAEAKALKKEAKAAEKKIKDALVIGEYGAGNRGDGSGRFTCKPAHDPCDTSYAEDDLAKRSTKAAEKNARIRVLQLMVALLACAAVITSVVWQIVRTSN